MSAYYGISRSDIAKYEDWILTQPEDANTSYSAYRRNLVYKALTQVTKGVSLQNLGTVTINPNQDYDSMYV